MKGNWIVAIDAGGTSSKAVLVTRSLQVMARTSGPSFNMRRNKIDVFRNMMIEVVRELFGSVHLTGHIPSAIAVGAAGAGRPEERAMLREVITGRYPQCLALVHHDAFIAHYGAFGGDPGVMVTAGTGSIAFGINAEGEEARSGGWGWILGDEGSGWWIGREAVRAALAAWEGSGPATALEELVRSRFQLESTYDVVPQLYRDAISINHISDLAQQVASAADDGDEVARDILQRAGRELGRLGVNVARKLGIGPRVLKMATLGSVATGAKQWIHPGVRDELGRYAAEAVIQAEPQQRSEQQVEPPEDPRTKATPSALPEVHMPVYPAVDTTIVEKPGPLLVEPRDDALMGAARWAADRMNRPTYA